MVNTLNEYDYFSITGSTGTKIYPQALSTKFREAVRNRFGI
jgi:hypothetical protein